jgi:hypothetical protein
MNDHPIKVEVIVIVICFVLILCVAYVAVTR